MRFHLTILLLILTIVSQSQTVGLVLSGGGAKGLAHVGVIKALEENHIPIDYIAGTSMGAIVAGLYAIGFSPEEMTELLKSKDFLQWSVGYIDIHDKYYYKLKNEMPDWAEFSIKKEDGTYKPELPTNIISPEQMDLRFIQFFEPAGSGANYNFNNLMVPFFCMATDVHQNRPVILNSGNLSTAIRASMTFPGYFKPIEIDSVLLFDGGMENNFPTDIMMKQFNPEVLIGSKVASNPKKPNPNDLYKQLENVFMKNTNYNMPENGILIEPDVEEYGLMDFSEFDSLYQKGYCATQSNIDTIKLLVNRSMSIDSLNKQRKTFKLKEKKLIIKNIYITGVNEGSIQYILKNIKRNRETLTFNEFELEYFKLLSDKLIQSIYPRMVYNSNTNYFDVYLDIKIKNELNVLLGGNISSNLRNLGFAQLDYIFQKKNAYNLSTNFMVGQFYNSVSGKFRMDFPPRSMRRDRTLSPFYIDISATNSYWNFFKITSEWFIDNKSPTKVELNESHFQSNFGRPIYNRGILYTGFAYGQTDDRYFHTNLIERDDVPDNTKFDYSSIHLTYGYSTLNYKEYANEGRFFKFQFRYITGSENYNPGTTTGLINPTPYRDGHSWTHFRCTYEEYNKLNKKFTLGIKSNIIYSTKQSFNNSMASLLSAYTFQPFPQSKLVLLEKFRAHSFIGAGVIPILNITETISLRTEAYIFQPYHYINIENYGTSYSKNFPAPNLAALAAAVYQSPLGPFAVTASYFMNEETPLYFQVNFGYVLFNNKGLD